MNRSTLFLLGSLIFLLNCSGAHGQGCAVTLSPHFSVYTSIGREGKNIYTSVSMQGYASVAPGPGCNMSVATHKVGAENKLNNVDHWTYSGSGCPTCYFSVTNNQQIVGVPGVVYPFLWDGQAICSIVGAFYNGGGSSSIPGCLVPSTETTTIEAAAYTTQTAINQHIGDTAGDSFDGLTVQEDNAAPGQDTCWGTWSIGPRVTGVPTNPPSSWTVAGGQVVGQPNHWGFDYVGWS